MFNAESISFKKKISIIFDPEINLCMPSLGSVSINKCYVIVTNDLSRSMADNESLFPAYFPYLY